MDRFARTLGTALIAMGLLGLAWVVTVWRWQDPFTALYTHYEQQQLARSLERQFEAYRPRRTLQSPSAAAAARQVALAAAHYRQTTRPGQAIGRIIVPRMHLDMVFVNGTDAAELREGPGRYLGSAMPGEHRLVYLAGHRTTYLAPFLDIDRLRSGDEITLRMPYGSFVYRVTGHRIVSPNAMWVLRSPDHEQLELQACHPRFFATRRYVVYARNVEVVPVNPRS